MDAATSVSKNRVLIRLTEERWKHIVLMHPALVYKQTQVLNTVENPDYIFKGKVGELLGGFCYFQKRLSCGSI